jgi:yeast amino acid transporter
VFWRVLLFYIVSLSIIGSLVPYTHPRLGIKQNSADVNASPFVLAVLDAQIPVVPHIVNAVILISVLSVGNASTFAASRTLEALAEIGQCPKLFTYIDKKGRPLATLALVLAFGPLAFVGAYDGGQIFDWLFALCGLSNFFTWYVDSLVCLTPGAQSVWRISDSDRQSKDKHTWDNWPLKTFPTMPF